MNNPKESIAARFGANVFNDAVMRERLPLDVYNKLKSTIEQGVPLEEGIADIVADAMKEWALEKGATHFCHWFQPLTGMTAEKHAGFMSPVSDGRTIMEFGGKELTMGEPDASSFPSGGLRATYEARGYTAWDCTSPVFIKQTGSSVALFIPTAFCSYNGQALDKKTPLLRSMDALNKQALRVLRALGDDSTARVLATLGAEQEYFLIPGEYVQKRLDLLVCGRTLFGAPPPKGQEMEDHYFGSLHERVASYMCDVNDELWRLGVPAKIQHNEVAPSQYELAPVYETINVATDHNQMMMEVMQKVALRHGMVCLLHEKPFAGVSGSGKHNNWSMITDRGVNLLEPGNTPHEDMLFLVMLCAIIQGVARYSRLLHCTAATAGNDHRLGANEAPPPIISIFLGNQLTDIFEQLENGSARSSLTNGELKLGVSILPPLPMDCTDRNRTSPFAFTGNKFEFRMVGSAQSVAGPGFTFNTIVADSLMEIADEFEGAPDINVAAQSALQRIVRQNKNIIFNGDNYSPEWMQEAQERGLPLVTNTVDSLRTLIDDEVVALFGRHGVLSAEELQARYEIFINRYAKEINIEANTALQMLRRQILPVVIEYAGRLAETGNAVRAANADSGATDAELGNLCGLISDLRSGIVALEAATAMAGAVENFEEAAAAYRDKVLPALTDVRAVVDALECVVDSRLWPLPTYAQMLFVK